MSPFSSAFSLLCWTTPSSSSPPGDLPLRGGLRAGHEGILRLVPSVGISAKYEGHHVTGPIVSKVARNEATNDELASIHLASLPKNIPSDMRKSLAEHIRRVISPGAVRRMTDDERTSTARGPVRPLGLVKPP